MPMYVVEGGMGRLVMRADNRGKALTATRRRYGTANQPYKTLKATEDDLQQHLMGGAVFFESDFSVMDPKEAYPLAGLETPVRYAVG